MCGFAGLIDSRVSSHVELAAVAAAMGDAVSHRGPDDDGLWSDPAAGVGLAHRRLAVIDLSEHGSQPMVSADGRWVLAYNGEIYNFPDMADQLRGQGVRLKGHSDTEVLLETIAQSSVHEALTAANGMFALALWDRQERRLTLARDRLGEKPLYYAVQDGLFVFASELQALRRHPDFRAVVDPRTVSLFVRHGFVPGEHAIYQGVRRLPPGSTVTFRPGDASLEDPEPYWSLDQVAGDGLVAPARRTPRRDSEMLVAELHALLEDAVRIRMVSDVPLGAFLSGGLDSSLVVALMQRVSPEPVRTFTMSVGGRGDEAAHGAAIAGHLGTNHEVIELSELDALRLATDLPASYDEPFADPSALPTMLLCTAARRHVTVCLSGDGGDEIAAGYNRYRATRGVVNTLATAPAWLRQPLAAGLLRVPVSTMDAILSRVPGVRRVPDSPTKVHKLAQLMAAGAGHGGYRALTTSLDPSLVLQEPAEHPTRADRPGLGPAGLTELEMMLLLDQQITLPDDMLVKVDRASMQVALECRVPLLDHRVVEKLWSYPADAKVRDGQAKWILRRILDDHVPRALVERPKQGFDPPLAHWLRGPLRAWTGDLLQGDRLRAQGIFDERAVARLLQEHQSGRRNHDYALWTLVTFQAWLDRQEQLTETLASR